MGGCGNYLNTSATYCSLVISIHYPVSQPNPVPPVGFPYTDVRRVGRRIFTLDISNEMVEISSKGGKFSPESGDIGSELVVRSLTEASVGIRLNLPGVDNRQYYETAYETAYGAYKSAGKCCRLKEKAERKSS